jgi:hypothetical protein
VNYVWANDCDGYLILLTWIMDALQVRNGIVKAYWDSTPETEAESFTGLSDEQLVILFDDPDVEVVGYDAQPQMVQDPATGQPMPLQLHDVKIRRRTSSGRLVIENVPPEDFGISRRAKSIDKARCVWHRTKLTRSDLLKQGYKRDLVWSLPASDGAPSETIDREQDAGVGAEGSGANTEIDIVEAYVFADCDGDGIAESRKVVTAGGAGGRKILKNEEWSDDRPFADLIAQAVPHRWMGRSIADDVMDLMRVKTSLWRGVLDNTYAQNRPQREAVQDDIINPDEVLNPTFGGVIRVKKAGAVRDVVTPQIADKILVAIHRDRRQEPSRSRVRVSSCGGRVRGRGVPYVRRGRARRAAGHRRGCRDGAARPRSGARRAAPAGRGPGRRDAVRMRAPSRGWPSPARAASGCRWPGQARRASGERWFAAYARRSGAGSCIPPEGRLRCRRSSP